MSKTLIPSKLGPERNLYWAVLTAVIVIHLAMVWVPAYNTLVDYPFHLARAWVLHAQTPFFHAIFIRSLTPLPNLAIDLVVPPLLYLFRPFIAGKIFSIGDSTFVHRRLPSTRGYGVWTARLDGARGCISGLQLVLPLRFCKLHV